MDFDEACAFMGDKFGTKSDFVFKNLNQACVFRAKNGKWFGVLMMVEANRLDKMSKGGKICVLNLKSEPDLAKILIDNRSIFAAYHMSKKHWISVICDRVDDKLLKDLIKNSLRLVSKTSKNKR